MDVHVMGHHFMRYEKQPSCWDSKIPARATSRAKLAQMAPSGGRPPQRLDGG